METAGALSEEQKMQKLISLMDRLCAMLLTHLCNDPEITCKELDELGALQEEIKHLSK
jgi:hypothetical protein